MDNLGFGIVVSSLYIVDVEGIIDDTINRLSSVASTPMKKEPTT
jgi:hypothetical protein